LCWSWAYRTSSLISDLRASLMDQGGPGGCVYFVRSASVGDSRNSPVTSLIKQVAQVGARIVNDVFVAVHVPLSPGTCKMLPGIVGGAEAVEVGSTSSHLACHDPHNLSPVQATLDPVRVARGCQEVATPLSILPRTVFTRHTYTPSITQSLPFS